MKYEYTEPRFDATEPCRSTENNLINETPL